jgi:hypothetical protein
MTRTVFSTPFSSVAALIATPIDFIPGVTGVAAAAPSTTVAIVASVIIITPMAIACRVVPQSDGAELHAFLPQLHRSLNIRLRTWIEHFKSMHALDSKLRLARS